MKLRTRNVFFLALVAIVLPALALVPLQGVFAAHATKHSSVDVSRPRIVALRSSPNNSNVFVSTRNLLYHGGPVMINTAHVYAIFWEPTASFVSSGYNALITRYFHDIGGSGLYHNDSQYTQSGGRAPTNAVLAATTVDTSAYATDSGRANTLLDSDIQAEVAKEQTVNGWTSNTGNVFFVFLAFGEDLCFDNTFSECFSNVFCGYHSFFGANTIYAALPYVNTFPGCNTPTSPNHNPDADSTINVTSHEQNESATDPLLNAWFDNQGNEIGDKCDFNFGTVNGSGANVTLNGHPYIVQKEWDNMRRGCVLSGP